MISEPLVSIIMGIYNCESTLERAIDSIINQTYDNWELILCDDCSTDKTYEIATKYFKLFPDKIRVIRNSINCKLAFSLNRCLKESNGIYIARMDSDDVSLPSRLEKQVLFLENNPSYSCVGSSIILFDENGDYGVRKCVEIPNKNCLVHGSPFAHPTILIRKKVMDELGGYTVDKHTSRCEDLDLWFRFFYKNYLGYNIKEPLYKYQESLADYKKRTFRASLGIRRVMIRGFKLLGFHPFKRIYALKPLIASILPKRILFNRRKKKYKRLDG